MTKKKCIIIDIDDTLVFENYLDDLPTENNRETWDEYHCRRKFYEPEQYTALQEVIDMIKSYYIYKCCDPFLVFLTSREDTCNGKIRTNTLKLIYKLFGDILSIRSLGFGKNSHALLMRKENDYRPSAVVKEDLLNEYVLHDYQPILAVDDDTSNIKMFTSKGAIGLQVHNYMRKTGEDNG